MRRLSATHTWFVYEAVASFFWTLSFTVAAVFFVLELGLSPLELVLVGTAMELAVFVFEVPTGIVADTYGRKRSVVIGMFVLGGSYLLVGVSTAAVGVIAAYAVWGLGWTFLSGAFDAWLADEVGEERLAGVYHRGAQIDRVAGLLGIGVSVGLAPGRPSPADPRRRRGTIALGRAPARRDARDRLPAEAEGGTRPARARWRRPAARASAPSAAGRSSLAILGIAAFGGMWSETFDRLWEAHFLENVGLPGIGELEPVVWFGILNAGSVLLAIAVAVPLGKRLGARRPGEAARVLFVPRCVPARQRARVRPAGLALACVGASGRRGSPGTSPGLSSSPGCSGASARRTLGRRCSRSRTRPTQSGNGRAARLSVGSGTCSGSGPRSAAGAFCMAPALWLYGRAARHDGRIEELEADPAVV